MKADAEYKDGTLHVTFGQINGNGDLEARKIAVLGLYAEDGKLVGVDIPEFEMQADTNWKAKDGICENVPIGQRLKAAEEEMLAWLSTRNALPHPSGKPFNPDECRASEPLRDDDEFYEILESFRRPEPWRNPWD